MGLLRLTPSRMISDRRRLAGLIRLGHFPEQRITVYGLPARVDARYRRLKERLSRLYHEASTHANGTSIAPGTLREFGHRA
jgi:hypothetical protein